MLTARPSLEYYKQEMHGRKSPAFIKVEGRRKPRQETQADYLYLRISKKVKKAKACKAANKQMYNNMIIGILQNAVASLLPPEILPIHPCQRPSAGYR